MTPFSATSDRTAPDAGPSTNAASFSSTDERFHLSGPTVRLDARINAYRDDLADIALAGRVLAPHYAKALIRACGAHAAYVRAAAGEAAAIVSELLPGEDFAVLEYAGGWAWGYAVADRAVGYVEAIALAAPAPWTHVVCESWAPVAPDGRITTPLIARLPMGSRLHGEECGACLTTEYGCVALSHLRAIADHGEDPAAVAERLMGTPYLAGGRSPAGIDAAGLIQLALGLAGREAPRFLDQLATLGQAVAEGAPLRRGDLVVAGETAGLMIDDLMLIHADQAAGKVTVAPYAAVAKDGAVRRRLD